MIIRLTVNDNDFTPSVEKFADDLLDRLLTADRVIGTGNASEAYVGWTTKWGDSAYDFNPIYHLTCTEVIEIGKILAKEFGLDEKYIDKIPSDGLTGKSDEENLGFTYEVLDKTIKGLRHPIIPKIIDMHKTSEHKRRMPYTVFDTTVGL